MALNKARRKNDDGTLNITSMMDMMTIILVFLLKSYSTQDISIAPSDDLELPLSTASTDPQIAVNLVVTKSQIIVDGVEILKLGEEPDPVDNSRMRLAVPQDEKRGQLINHLHEVLLDKAEGAKSLGDQSGSDEHSFKGRLLIQCHKTLPFSVLREVMYTAGQAQFSEFRFVVYKQE
jgi:biopolymer transport protein ExbD